MKVLETEFAKGFIRLADDGFRQGWHERNGGNLSYRLTREEAEEIQPEFDFDGKWRPIGASVPGLADEYFMVTGSGKFFRNVILDPEDTVAIIRVDQKGERYQIVWGLKNGGNPTSELPTHLMNHEVKKRKSEGKHG